jgi:hypothetical protein
MAKKPFVHYIFLFSASTKPLLTAWHYVAAGKNCQKKGNSGMNGPSRRTILTPVFVHSSPHLQPDEINSP